MRFELGRMVAASLAEDMMDTYDKGYSRVLDVVELQMTYCTSHHHTI
jgi:hypothetical protein